MAVSIPVIDVSPLIQKVRSPDILKDQKVQEVVKELHEACTRIGFFYVKGHGVPGDLMQKVLDVSREFFMLPDEEKLTIKMSSSSHFRGYQKVGENITKGHPDFHEAVDFFREVEPGSLGLATPQPVLGQNQWPSNPPNFRAVFEEYLILLKDLGRSIMHALALALGGPRDAFEGERAGDPFWILRVIGYPPAQALEDFEIIGCGEHTDYGLLTFVNQDSDISALQVKTDAGIWVWAHPIPGTFIVNIGDMLKVWSNGLYRSTIHRVINNNLKYRVSVPFFYEPNFNAHVQPLEFCVGEGGPDPSFRPVVYGDHLTAKVLTNFV